MKNGLPQNLEDVAKCLDKTVQHDTTGVKHVILGATDNNVYLRAEGRATVFYVSFGALHCHYTALERR